jgi:hypothetical protein
LEEILSSFSFWIPIIVRVKSEQSAFAVTYLLKAGKELTERNKEPSISRVTSAEYFGVGQFSFLQRYLFSEGSRFQTEFKGV